MKQLGDHDDVVAADHLVKKDPHDEKGNETETEEAYLNCQGVLVAVGSPDSTVGYKTLNGGRLSCVEDLGILGVCTVAFLMISILAACSFVAGF
jgi:hypothetical protein